MPDLPLEISCQDAHRLCEAGQRVLILDCREPHEHALAHMAHARLLPMSEIANRLGELAGHESERLVVHCHHGGRSLRVAQWLREQGFANAQSLAGGIDAWAVEVDPTVPRY